MAIAVLSTFIIVSSSVGDTKQVDGAVYGDSLAVYDYLNSFGIETDFDGLIEDEIKVPDVFNDVYESYNKIQISQGFDLSKYKGVVLKRCTFPVTNYTDKEQNVFAEVLLCDGTIVAADIYSTSAEGFIKALK